MIAVIFLGNKNFGVENRYPAFDIAFSSVFYIFHCFFEKSQLPGSYHNYVRILCSLIEFSVSCNVSHETFIKYSSVIQDGGALFFLGFFFCILGKVDLYFKTFKETFKISLEIASLNSCSKCTCFYGITIFF